MSIIYRNKAAAYRQRHGYQLRGTTPTSIVIHTTNNRRVTKFADEVDYLFSSAAVSAHFLISKDGQVVQFLDPKTWQAWHAGGRQEDGTWSAQIEFSNSRSIGIELHVSLKEQPTTQQIAALTPLVQSLLQQFKIPLNKVETHRAIALPKGRKSDPEGWGDAAFYAWRNGLNIPTDPFDAWGPIGKPEGDARGWAVPRAWLQNPKLGRCLAAEDYRQGTEVSTAVFEHGVIVYKGGDTNHAYVVMF